MFTEVIERTQQPPKKDGGIKQRSRAKPLVKVPKQTTQ